MSPDDEWQAFCRELTMERFGKPVPEFHNRVPAERDDRALRLVWVDEDERRTA